MKLNRSDEIKYVPKQAFNTLNVPFTTFLNFIFFHKIWFSMCGKYTLNQ